MIVKAIIDTFVDVVVQKSYQRVKVIERMTRYLTFHWSLN